MVDNGTNQKQNCSQGTGSHVETIGSIQLDNMLRKACVAHVDRRLRRYYLIVRLLPNVFCSCLPFLRFDVLRYGVTS